MTQVPGPVPGNDMGGEALKLYKWPFWAPQPFHLSGLPTAQLIDEKMKAEHRPTVPNISGVSARTHLHHDWDTYIHVHKLTKPKCKHHCTMLYASCSTPLCPVPLDSIAFYAILTHTHTHSHIYIYIYIYKISLPSDGSLLAIWKTPGNSSMGSHQRRYVLWLVHEAKYIVSASLEKVLGKAWWWRTI